LTERLASGESPGIALPFFEVLNICINLVARPLDQIGMSAFEIIEVPRATQQIDIDNFDVGPALFHLLFIKHWSGDLPILCK
jgi:hypothetical protein